MGSLFGLTSGVVTAVGDSEGLGRVRIALPSMGISDQWAKVVAHARPSMAPNAMILVGFVDGNPDFPVVLGALGPD